MDEADLAIGAASSASWERCTLGLPALLVTLADNQVAGERLLVEAGAAVSHRLARRCQRSRHRAGRPGAPGRPRSRGGDVGGGGRRDRRPRDGAGRGRDRIDRGKQDGGEMSGEGVTTPTLAPFAINGRRIGPGHPVYVIAEISSNHGQRFESAVELVHGAHAAGADAVKLQTYTPDTITIDANSPAFVSGEGSLWEGTTSPRPVPDGIHAVGLAAQAESDRRRARDGPLLGAVRPDGSRLPRGHGRPGLQDRLVRARRPAAHPDGRPDRPADDHVNRDGHRRRDRRGRGRGAGRRCDRYRPPQVLERLSVAARSR